MKVNTVIQGDCLEVMRGMDGESVDFILTDPPYGFNWQSNRRKIRHEKIKNDNRFNWLRPAFSEMYRTLKNNSLCVSFYGYPDADIFVTAFKSVGFAIKSHFCFLKSNIGLGWFARGQHEVAYLLAKGKPSRPKHAYSDVIPFKLTGNKLHPTQKPINAMGQIIKSFTTENAIVLDPFCGSGSTLVAANNLGRRYIGIEIEEKYCEIARKRLLQQTLELK
jgi:DNA modification methylase